MGGLPATIRKEGHVQVIRFDDTEPYEPAGHHGVLNRLLVGRASGDVHEVSIWHGTIDPGGSADPHVHEHSVQVYITVSGMLTVAGSDDAAADVGPGDVALFAAGERHEIHNDGDAPASLYVISAPALR
jgi:mannose-6-phosphate isomerase-like protein (cupin superfamily)